MAKATRAGRPIRVACLALAAAVGLAVLPASLSPSVSSAAAQGQDQSPPQAQRQGPPAVAFLAPTVTEPVVTEAGTSVEIALDANRDWPYVIDARGPGTGGEWAELPGGSGEFPALVEHVGVHEEVPESFEQVIAVEVPDSFEAGDYDLRVRLFTPNSNAAARQPRDEDVVEGGLQVAAPQESFVEDFEGQPVGDPPAGWSPAWASEPGWQVVDREGPDGESRQLEDAGPMEGYRTLRWDEPGEAADSEVLALTQTTSATTTQMRLHLRLQGEAGSEQGYSMDLRSNGLRVNRFQDGHRQQLGSVEDFDLEPDTWVWMRFRIEGDELLGKAWPAGSSEPEEWLLERQDDVVSDPGGVGVGGWSTSGERYYDYIATSQDGSVVPTDIDAVSGSDVYATDFSTLQDGALPDGWTPVWASRSDWRVTERNDVDGEQSHQIEDVGTEAGYRTLKWDEAGEPADAELLALTETTSTSGTQMRLHLRLAGETGSEQGYSMDLRSNGLRINRFLDGDRSQLGSLVDVDFQADSWMWMRFRAEGDRLLGKAWPAGTAEPSEWTIQRSDQEVPDPGGVAIGRFSASGTAYFDRVELTTDFASSVTRDDFGSVGIGGVPSGWSPASTVEDDWQTIERRSEAMPAEGGFAVEDAKLADLGSVTGDRSLRWDDAGQTLDGELLLRANVSATSGVQLRSMLRMHGEADDLEGYSLDLADGGLQVSRWTDGEPSVIGDHEDLALETDTWHWLRFRAQGDQLLGRIWPAGTEEPDEWAIERQDDGIQDRGNAAIGAQATSGTRYIDYVSKAAEGITAPMPEMPSCPCPEPLEFSEPAFPTATPETVGLDPSGLESIMDQIDDWVEAGEMVGAAVTVARHGKLVWNEARGWADRDEQVPMETHNVFDLRSMAKSLTGTSVLILQDDEELHIDDRVADHLPSWEEHEWSRQATIRQVASHTAGIVRSDLTSPPLRAAIDDMGRDGPSHEPGTRYNYTDASTAVLSAIVEEVSGVSPQEFIRARILEPLEMRESYLWRTAWDDPRRAYTLPAYTGSPGDWSRAWTPTQEYQTAWFTGASRFYTTSNDFMRFKAMLLNNGELNGVRILSPESVELATQVAHSADVFTDDEKSQMTRFYGLQWYVESDEWLDPSSTAEPGPGAGGCTQPCLESHDFSPSYFSHGGALGTYAWADPDNDLIVTFFTQSQRHDQRYPFVDLLYDAILRGAG